MYNNPEFKRNLIFLLVIIAAFSLLRSFSFEHLFSIILMLPGLVLALTIHEFSHAKMSDKLGDPTPSNQGRLTLNPLAHMDLMGTICLLFAGFGWGKPVQIDPSYYRNPARDNMLVTLAGPVSNFILSFISFLVYGFAYYMLPLEHSWAVILLTMIFSCAQLNLSLAVFNLLPFPPLDGSKVLAYFLKGKARDFIWFLERYSFVIILILFITDIPALLISPVVNFIGNRMIDLTALIISPFFG